MDEEKSAIHFIYQQEQGNTLWKLRTMQYSAYDVCIIAVILTRFVHKGVSNAMSSSSAVPREAGLCSTSSMCSSGLSSCTNLLGEGQTWPPHCNGAAHRQLLLSTGDCTPRAAFPLAESAAVIYYE